MQQLNDILSKIPVLILALLYCGYIGYDFYDFKNSPESELGQKKAQLAAVKVQLEGTKKRLNTAEDFFKNLEAIRTRIRSLSQQLENTKTALNNDIDLANFIRMVTLEAKKLGLTIVSIRPNNDIKRDYYIEVPFTIAMKGAYVQMLVFFDRMVRLQQLIKVSGFDLRPIGNTYSKYVELEGNGTIVTYKYVGSEVDNITNQEWMKSNEEGLKKVQEIQSLQKGASR
jgi:type IV pilus assembly protein PilO